MKINDVVLDALRSGAESIPDAVRVTGMPYAQVKNAVQRLRHYQVIRQVGRYPSRYALRAPRSTSGKWEESSGKGDIVFRSSHLPPPTSHLPRMKLLVVGATGFIGSALLNLAHGRGYDVAGTSRRVMGGFRYYDLLDPLAGELPPCHAAYLCAGIADYRKSEGNPEAWRVNVDGNMACGKRLMKSGAFVVFLSSVAAEWAHGTAYGRAKVAVEHYLQAIGDPAIVRFDRVRPDNLTDVCAKLIEIGTAKRAGIHHL